MKKTLRSAMLSTICMLVVAVMSLTGVTYAWFSASETAKVEGMTMNVAAADGGFLISDSQNGPWVSTLTWTDADKSSVKPVSTVNAKDFFTAEVNSMNVDQIKTTKDTTENNIIKKTFYAKNTGETKITIKLANASADTLFVDTVDSDVKNSAKAGRVAIFVEDDLVYIFGDETTYGVNSASDAFFTFRGDQRDTEKTEEQPVTTNPAECTFEIDGRNGTAEDTIVKITVVVWLEGQDVDCENVNANSAFDINLDFAVVK